VHQQPSRANTRAHKARVLALLLPLTAVAGAVQAATFRVGTAGATCTSPTHATVKLAIAAADTLGGPHTVEICPGSYAESDIKIDKANHVGLTIRSTTGVAADVTINGGTNCGGDKVLFIDKRSGITVRGLTITHTDTACDAIRGDSASDFTGQDLVINSANRGFDFVNTANNFTLDNVRIAAGAGTSHEAVYLVGAGDKATISRLTVTSTGAMGVYAYKRSAGVTLTDVNITAGLYGVYLDESPGSSIGVFTYTRNAITAVERGIFLNKNKGSFSIADTDVTTTATGTSDRDGISATSEVSGAWSIERVTIDAGGGRGIDVKDGTAGVLQDLVINAKMEGIRLEKAIGFSLTTNQLWDNKITSSSADALYLRGDNGAFVVRNTTMTSNASDSKYHGFYVEKNTGAWEISGNRITRAAGNGIHFGEAGTGGQMFGNTIRGVGGYALNLGTSKAAYGTTVHDNCFYATHGSNNAYGKDTTAAYDNGSKGNFWGSSTGTTGFSETCIDANANGICDATYTVPGDPTRSDTRALKTAPAHCSQTGGFSGLRIEHGTGNGLTCTPSTVTVRACLNSDCSTDYTGGVSGTLTAIGAGMTVNFPGGAAFTIPSGSSTTTVTLQQVTAGSTTLGASGVSPAPTTTTTCNFGSPECTFTAADSGLLFDVPDHVSEVAQTVSVSAVKKSDSSLACTPAFASTTKPVTFKCIYTDPGTGTLPVRVAGAALNAGNNAAAACDGSGRAVSLAFDANGTASTTVQYADAGRVGLAATYTGSGNDAGLVLAGEDSFIAAPAAFAFSGITAAPIRAGANFSATVTAHNSAGNATPNFGRESSPESAALAFTRRAPTGTGTSAGAFSGSLGGFSGGAASSSTLQWSEVGTGDLSATLASGSYLGSGLVVSGSTGSGGAVGRFIPHHFTVAVTPACSGSFTYSGQPFAATVSAHDAAGAVTVNYDGSAFVTPATHAKAVTLSDAGAAALGSFTAGSALAASAFRSGVAAAAPTYTFSGKLTAPGTLVLRATDSDAVSSSGYAEGSTVLRSGRLRVAGGIGRENAPLPLAVQAEYWTGSSWLLNGSDSCTSVPATAVALGQYRNHLGAATTSWGTSASAVTLASGWGLLTLAAPSPAATGSVSLALNLGSGTADQSCTSGLPATVGAALPWLRSLNGACAATHDRDPAARASFGIYSPETRRTVHARELF
jgi:hypothetical protein